MDRIRQISSPEPLPWDELTDPEISVPSARLRALVESGNILDVHEIVVPNFKDGPHPTITWTKEMMQLLLKHVHMAIYSIWDLIFPEDLWRDILNVTAALNKEFPLGMTFVDVIFQLRMLALVEVQVWTPEMVDLLLEHCGDVKDHLEATEKLSRKCGQISPMEVYRKLMIVRFSGEEGEITMWTEPMVNRLKEHHAKGEDIDQITDVLFEEFDKPKFREDTKLKLLQVTYTEAFPNAPTEWSGTQKCVVLL